MCLENSTGDCLSASRFTIGSRSLSETIETHGNVRTTKLSRFIDERRGKTMISVADALHVKRAAIFIQQHFF